MEKRSTFSGSVGFVLAAAGSAVGLGNIWRFPYLAAKNGGLFLIVYIILALTFGFTLLTTEVAIGRKTKQSCLTAYGKIHQKWGFLGVLASVVPFIILPYYCVIGGWVLKYAMVFITGQGAEATDEGFFSAFITGTAEPIIYNIVFLLLTAFVVFRGVNKGIEKISTVLMPVLLVMIIGIAIFSVTISYGSRRGVDGAALFLIPDLNGVTFGGVMGTVMDAMGQLFYSISVAMGIMVTYGSYLKDKDNLLRAVGRIEIFDTAVAVLAGLMVIPVVYVLLGESGLEDAGPGLLFVAMPKIFVKIGVFGNILGAAFFIMVFFAALTSCISLMEAVCSGMVDKGMSRKKATLTESLIALVISTVVCLGYNLLYFSFRLPNGGEGQILDILDYLANNALMPILAILTCILIGWVVKPKTIIDEVTKNGERFRRRGMYVAMVKVIAPVMLVLLLLVSFGVIKS